MLTDVQQQAIHAHLEWCKQTIAENDASIAWWSEPGRHLKSSVNDGPLVDVTEDHLAKLTRINMNLRAIVNAYTEKGFQAQVGEPKAR